MNRYLIILAAAVLGSGALLLSSAWARQAPGITLTPAQSDLGRVLVGTAIHRDYRLENRTDHPVRFHTLRRSCGCQDFEIGAQPIPEGQSDIDFELGPGESTSLRMSLIVPAKTREFEFQLVGRSGASAAGQPVDLRAALAVDGYRAFSLERAVVDVGELPWSGERAVEWRVVADSGRPVELARTVRSPGLSAVEVVPGPDSCTIRGLYHPRGWGRQTESIELVLADGSSLTGAVRAVVPEPFTLSERFLRLGILLPGQSVEHEVDLPLRSDFAPPATVAVGGRVGEVAEVEVQWCDGRLVCRCVAGDSPGPLSGWIAFGWGDECPEFRLPLHGFVRGS